MGSRGLFGSQAVGRFNGLVETLRTSRQLGPWLSRWFTTVTYTGRRSGRTFSTPVGYRRADGGVVIDVWFPEAKQWWRNFLGDGHPITVELDGVARTGHARVRSRTKQKAVLAVQLDAA